MKKAILIIAGVVVVVIGINVYVASQQQSKIIQTQQTELADQQEKARREKIEADNKAYCESIPKNSPIADKETCNYYWEN